MTCQLKMIRVKGPNYDKSNLNKSGYTSHYYKISQNITKKLKQ